MIANREHLRRLSRRMYVATSVFLVLIAAYALFSAIWALMDKEALAKYLANHFDTAAYPVSVPVAVLMVVLFLAQVAVFLYGLNCLRITFSVISRQDTIDRSAGTLMRRAGICFAATAAIMILLQPILSALFSISAPPGSRFINLEVGSGEAMTLLMSGVFVVIGHLIVLAAEVDDDNRQIV